MILNIYRNIHILYRVLIFKKWDLAGSFIILNCSTIIANWAYVLLHAIEMTAYFQKSQSSLFRSLNEIVTKVSRTYTKY